MADKPGAIEGVEVQKMIFAHPGGGGVPGLKA
jgi:hypothetical protein